MEVGDGPGQDNLLEVFGPVSSTFSVQAHRMNARRGSRYFLMGQNWMLQDREGMMVKR